MPVEVSSYLACITYLLFVMSPLFIPIGVTIHGAVRNRREQRRELQQANTSEARHLNTVTPLHQTARLTPAANASTHNTPQRRTRVAQKTA